jgi:hypothetical protein
MSVAFMTKNMGTDVDVWLNNVLDAHLSIPDTGFVAYVPGGQGSLEAQADSTAFGEGAAVHKDSKPPVTLEPLLHHSRYLKAAPSHITC